MEKIIGIDEAGKGAMAGPVVSCACIILETKDENFISSIKDSKKLTSGQRVLIYKKAIYSGYVMFGLGIVYPNIIDNINIHNATMMSMSIAYQNLCIKNTKTVVDGIFMPKNIGNAKCVKKADDIYKSVSMASIIAKVVRDNYMKDISMIYPKYCFESNKGYGTKHHMIAIKEYGKSKHHRKSFKVNGV